MPEDFSAQHTQEARIEAQPLPALYFALQLQNIVVLEIVARRFSAEATNLANGHVNLELEDVQIIQDHAQIVLNVQLRPVEVPQPFEISFKLLGIFTYIRDYPPEQVRQFLEQGSLSVLLPFARELLISLCTRLQIPVILLPMVQLTSPPQDLEQAKTPDQQ